TSARNGWRRRTLACDVFLAKEVPRMSALDRKVAIVAGASSGIGHPAAKLFAREGAKVVLGARRAAEIEALAAEITGDGGDAIPLAGDVRDEGFAAALVRLAVDRFGGLDVALNNAGGPSAPPA